MKKFGIVACAGVVLIILWMWRSHSSTEITQSASPRPEMPLSNEAPTALNPQVPAATAPSAVATQSPKILLLEEILKSKNDNDPRLDSEFLNLSEKEKELLREKYSALPAEKRNEKGTIVFLLGKNLKGEGDFRFLEGVLSEPPCYSLANCQGSSGSKMDSGHEDMGTAVTLAYPQIVSLKVVEKYLGVKDQAYQSQALRVIETGKTSPVKAVSNLADKLHSQFRK